MGSGTWSSKVYTTASTTGRGFATKDAFLHADVQELYTERRLSSVLNPFNVMRECSDSDEHPNTIPVILALDVTGSMGNTASSIAKRLDDIMTSIYEKVTDVEFCIMAIGDLSYDVAPIQMSQFESDIRINDQLQKVYFEGHGGGNSWESYTAAWYMGIHHTKLDCWKRGKKGIIITMGDEPMNPYLPKDGLKKATGDNLQDDVGTKDLYNEVCKLFDVYHIAVDDKANCYDRYAERIEKSWRPLLGQNLIVSKQGNLHTTISDIISNQNFNSGTSVFGTGGVISW